MAKPSRSPGCRETYHPEPEAAVAGIGHEPAATGRTAATAVVVPRSAAHHTQRFLRGWACGIFVTVVAAGVIVLIVPIGAPLPDIAVQVVQAEDIRLVRPDDGRTVERNSLFPSTIGVFAVEV